MIYAIIGIPIGLVMFNSIGERFNYFSSMIINKFRKMVKAQQPETTELDLICVGLTLSGIVFTSGAAAFSHYEGKTNTKVITIYNIDVEGSLQIILPTQNLERSDNFKMSFWCLQILPINERRQVDLRYHSS